jgi:hypothetical protein
MGEKRVASRILMHALESLALALGAVNQLSQVDSP